MQVEQLTCSIGAELIGVNLADAVHDDGLFAEIRAQLLKHRVLFLRDQDISRAEHVAFARASANWRITRSSAAIRITQAWSRSTRTRTARSIVTRTPGTPTPPGARRRRWAACCVAWSARQWVATPCGPTWWRPTSICPTT